MENKAIEKYKKQCRIFKDTLLRRLSEDKENKKLVSEIPEFQTYLSNLNYNYLNNTETYSCQFVADYLKDVLDFLNDTSNTLLFFNFENIPSTWQENTDASFFEKFSYKEKLEIIMGMVKRNIDHGITLKRTIDVYQDFLNSSKNKEEAIEKRKKESRKSDFCSSRIKKTLFR